MRGVLSGPRSPTTLLDSNYNDIHGHVLYSRLKEVMHTSSENRIHRGRTYHPVQLLHVLSLHHRLPRGESALIDSVTGFKAGDLNFP